MCCQCVVILTRQTKARAKDAVEQRTETKVLAKALLFQRQKSVSGLVFFPLTKII